jgi:hypothetical protein
LVLVLALTASAAFAWDKRPDEGVVVLASKHLTPEAKALLDKHLGSDYFDDVHYLYTLEANKKAKHTSEIHYLHLGRNLRPVKVEGDDALVALEQAVEVIRNHKSQSDSEVAKALRVAINLMCDIHNLANVRIESVPHSQKDFTFSCYAGDIGKRKTVSKVKYSRLWYGYSLWHNGFSGALWAEDLEVCLGGYRAELAAGTLQDWALQIGMRAFKMYQKINSEYVMTRRERNELEMVNYEMMARAGYRLAALLNDAVK